MSRLTVKLKLDGEEVEFTGTAEEVLKSLLKFVSEVYPAFELVRSLTLTLDLEELSRSLRGLIAVHPKPTILVDLRRLTVSEGCLLTLILQYLAHAFGKSEKQSMSLEEISTLLGKSRKTVSARLSELLSRQLVDKVERGEYKVSFKGLQTFMSEIIPRLRGELSE